MKGYIRNALLLMAALLLFCGGAEAKSPEKKEKKDSTELYAGRTAVKLNAAIFAGVINPAVEFRVAKHFSVQLEVFGCFQHDGFLWTDIPVTLAASWAEFRYYPKVALRGFYVAGNMGFGVYRMSKGIAPVYWGTYPDSYQVGNNMMFGATIGYQFCIGRHWGIEISWGGGWQHSWYEGYKRSDDPALNGQMYVGWNKSGEWLPIYKGAINVIFRW